eukprot:1349472-Pyramimonas_sp.AAC.1
MRNHFYVLIGSLTGAARGRALLQQMATPGQWGSPACTNRGYLSTGHDTPMQFMYRSLNDISDGDRCNLD